MKIDHDEDLLSWNRFTAYPQLFCANIPNCPYCGKRLRMVEAKGRNNKFLYVCDWCPKEYNGQKLQMYIELIDRKRELIYGKFIKKKKG